MKLKKVLCVTFFTMIFLPIMLFMVVICLTGLYKLNHIKASYGIETFEYEDIQNSVQLLSKLTKKVHKELEQVAQEEPEKW